MLVNQTCYFFASNGLSQSYSDYSLFTYCRGLVRLNVLVYVDDIIISGSDPNALSSFKIDLGECFRMKHLLSKFTCHIALSL